MKRFPCASTLRVISACALLCDASSASAASVELGPGDDVEAAINAAAPGDEIVLAGGTYTLTERFGISVQGSVDAPIVIRAKEGERPVLNRPTDDQNVIDVDDARYLVFRGLEISGGSHGLRLVQASFVTVEDCEIHDTGDVALSANSGGAYQGLQILRNHIHHTNNTGEGMYLGCNEDACRIFDSLIEGNYVHHTNGPTVVQGDGIEIKEGSYNNIVRDNVIHDTNYPCILTYSTVGNGAPNVIERNALWNCGDHGIQSAADAVIRNNIILGSNADGIAMQPHQSGMPSNLVVVHNTILHAANDAISASGIAGSVVIANNALYVQSGNAISVGGDLTALVVASNFGQGAYGGPTVEFDGSGSIDSDLVAASFSGAPPNDVFPSVGSPLIGAGDPAHVASDDFNGSARAGTADIGAYKFAPAGNTGWPLGPGPKGATPTVGAGGAAGSAGAMGSGGAAATSGGAAGSVSAGGGPTGAGGMAGGGGSGAKDEDAGCGCRAAGSPLGRGQWVSALCGLVLLGLALRRTRRS